MCCVAVLHWKRMQLDLSMKNGRTMTSRSQSSSSNKRSMSGRCSKSRTNRRKRKKHKVEEEEQKKEEEEQENDKEEEEQENDKEEEEQEHSGSVSTNSEGSRGQRTLWWINHDLPWSWWCGGLQLRCSSPSFWWLGMWNATQDLLNRAIPAEERSQPRDRSVWSVASYATRSVAV